MSTKQWAERDEHNDYEEDGNEAGGGDDSE